jgi:hypothetical protein
MFVPVAQLYRRKVTSTKLSLDGDAICESVSELVVIVSVCPSQVFREDLTKNRYRRFRCLPDGNVRNSVCDEGWRTLHGRKRGGRA